MVDCYICFEECETLSPCKCRDLRLHTCCLEIQKIYGYDRCKICDTKFPEVALEKKDYCIPIACVSHKYRNKPIWFVELLYMTLGAFGIMCLLNITSGIYWLAPTPLYMWLGCLIYICILVVFNTHCRKAS
jgi:hypothetical protein